MAKTVDEIITEIIVREGGGKLVNIPGDGGGPTIWGISKRANPDLWVNGPPTEAQARQRYFERYVEAPGFELIPHEALKIQLIDFGVLSGPKKAIMELQGLLKLEADGILGPQTLSAATMSDPKWLNNQLVGARARMIGRIISKNPSQAKFAAGWLNRATDFLV